MAKDKIKVVIAYASAGAGHVKAAFALESGFRELDRGNIEIRNINTLDYSSDFLKKSYPDFYLFLVNRIPSLWGLGYYLFDTRMAYRAFVALARRINNAMHCRKLEDFLNDYNPDIILNTHFLGSEVMANMRRKGKLKDSKLITVVTDYMMHSFWVDKEADYYCVAQEDSKAHLLKRGVPADKIKVYGIPIDRVFAKMKGKKELCRKLDIREDLPTVLVTSGGYGVGPVKKLVLELARIEKKIQLLVVCGKNPGLHEEINSIAGSLDIPVKAYGFVDNMDELMEVSDVMVAKSGGMTSSEAMAKDLPVVITSAIPGQEARNCKYLVKSGSAVHAGNLREAKQAIADILSSEVKMSQMTKRISEIKKPDSSRDIANFALSLL